MHDFKLGTKEAVGEWADSAEQRKTKETGLAGYKHRRLKCVPHKRPVRAYIELQKTKSELSMFSS
jgi:hypothetical protein